MKSHKSRFALTVALCLLGSLGGACRSSDSDGSKDTGSKTGSASASQHYFQDSSAVTVEVWYEEAAAPYVQEFATQDFWDITRQNLTAIFQFRSSPPTLTVPSKLDAMSKLDIPSQANWTAEQIIALAKSHQKTAASSSSAVFYVYFLDGYFNKGQGSEMGILGVNLGGSNIVAMFKPVIRSAASGATDIVPKFVEQSTLVHELGHALGFVNNGVPMTSAYQDTEHGSHSKNENCVMFWLNEGTSNLKKFVVKYLTTQDFVMWGPEVIADAKALSK